MEFKHNLLLSKKDLERGLKFPKMLSSELAEIIGIHFGDGSMNGNKNTTYRLRVCFNLRDIEYADYVDKLFKNLFGLTFKRYYNYSKNYLELYVCSKSICEFYNKVLEIPFSPKMNLTIPEYIKHNPDYLIYFIRGLFDTDGCFTIQRDGKYSYPMAKICNGSEYFAIEINSALKSLGITSYISRKKKGFDVVIKRKESYELFLITIKPKNTRGK